MKKQYGVIGFPIGHSMSPLMQNDAFRRENINAAYEAIAVEPAGLGEMVQSFKEKQVAGFNVTIPHKVAIMAYLDEVDEVAKAIGAVNTVVLQDGKYKGYNTDGLGFVRGIENEYGSLQGKKVLLIGAGGACRGIFYTLASLGITEIDITNRTVEKAKQLIAKCTYPIDSEALILEVAQQKIGKYDMIVNTTSVGMFPHVEAIPLSLEGIKADAIVADIIYNPLETFFLQEAKKHGARIQNGISMFGYQGAIAFELWTGKMPDVSQMMSIVEQELTRKA